MSKPLLADTDIHTYDPNDLQGRAADPAQSVWVAASAGSGKTKVLTDRVLRLLLPPAEGQPGTRAEKILCLTFTKAGAAEMSVRITEALSRWAVQDEESLHHSLESLLHRPPRADEKEAARRLFAQVIDSPGGLKILTIHSFCQSILGRFPLEAGLSPQQNIADEAALRPLQEKALETVLIELENNTESPLYAAIQAITREKGEDDLTSLFQQLLGERTALMRMIRHYGGLEAAYAQICASLDVSTSDNPENLLENALSVPLIDEAGLRQACAAMAASSAKTMRERAPDIQALLDAPIGDKPCLYASYKAVFLTQKGERRSAVVTKDIAPDIHDIMQKEADRILLLEDRIKAVNIAVQTRHLLQLGLAVLEAYEAEKSRLAVMDYDDLIVHTLRLLSGDSMKTTPQAASQWVMYKLDQGIDHILVDEAQDTNPEQWDIIHALCREFFEGDGARNDITRSVFAVGDEKQSIFGFQRAAPEKFRHSEAYYKNKAQQSGQKFDSVPMNISFRSTASVLALSDAVFDDHPPGRMLGLPEGTKLRHVSYRQGQAGLVELWPLIRTNPPPDPEPWTPPIDIEDVSNAEALLSEQIALRIRNWLDCGERLDAYDRAITPGDILILVRSRSTLVARLVRALKSANLPVSGVDRMVLGDQIAVQDLLAAAQFALLPEDELNLACLLKSPLIGASEEDLFCCANGRSNSLWQSVKEKLDPAITAWLNSLIARAGTMRPYEFFSLILHMPCPAYQTGLGAMTRRLGEDCLDPLEEFLNLTLQYEIENTPSLQKFLHWQQEGDTTIKREMESASGKIRIMTVHASKGLQAPIVILPDTAHSAASIGKIGVGERFIWAAQAEGPSLPIWSPRKEDDCQVFAAALQQKRDRLVEEYNRLLYVALTRAADRLYVAGCVRGRDPAEHCWYRLVEQGFKRLEQQRDTGFLLEPLTFDFADTLGFRLSNAQNAAPDKTGKSAAKTMIHPACDDWSWLDKAPPEEESPPRPWTPSRPDEAEPAMRSPLDSGKGLDRFRRGLVTHSLLQFLPQLPAAEWEKAAAQFVAGQDLREKIKTEIVAETLRVLRHPDYAALFGPGSMAEIPITAHLGHRLVSGQIDRMIITDSEILIVDFKTNRPPPTEEKDVPALYRAQLRAYRDTLAKIYPDRDIHCFLLWTDGPHMMKINV